MILPGATLGLLGGGQLGRMLALAGYPLGLRFRFLVVAGAIGMKFWHLMVGTGIAMLPGTHAHFVPPTPRCSMRMTTRNSGPKCYWSV